MKRSGLRDRPRISYYEPNEPGLDEYIFCDQCEDYIFEYCAIHGPLLVIPDDEVPAKPDYPSYVPRAALTIPHVFLHLAHSNIPGAGLGVFSTRTLPRGVRFGPYRGTRSQDATSDYCWQIYDKNNKPSHLVDAADANKSNWMRYVNCSRHWLEQNLLAYQYQGQLYYRTIKMIPRSTELLVFYGSEFAHTLHVDLKKYNSPTGYAQKFGAPAPTMKKPRLETQKEKLQEKTAEGNSKNIGKESASCTLKKSISNTQSLSIDNKTTNEIAKKKRTPFKTPYRSNDNKPIVDTTSKKEVKNDDNNNFMQSDNIEIQTKSKTLNKDAKKSKQKPSLKLKPLNKGTKRLKAAHILDRNNKNDNLLICNECNQTFQTKPELVQHIETHARIVKEAYLYCDACKYRTTTNDSLQKHLKLHDIKRLHVCKHCGFRFGTNSHLKMHLQKHSSKRKHDCGICSYQTNHITALNIHLRVHAGLKPFSCTLCEYKCTQKRYLTSHIRTHTGEKPFSCTLCEYKCTQIQSLTSHIRTHTGEKPFSCSLCEVKFTQKQHLTTHLRTHTGEKLFSCSLCEYKCTDKRNLIQHLKTHTGEKPFSCTLCEYKCTQKQSLTSHIRTHTGEKPFSCSLCEVKFTQKQHLTTHLRTHTGEKLFSCSLCEYKCNDKRNLIKHLKTHTGEKPFSCSLCNYKCSVKCRLTKHLNTHK